MKSSICYTGRASDIDFQPQEYGDEDQRQSDMDDLDSDTTPEKETETYANWVNEVNLSLNALHRQWVGRTDRVGGREQGVSIVMIPPDEDSGREGCVCLVTWTQPGKMGRTVELDADCNLIPVVCVGKKRLPTDFAAMEAEVLVPATGVNFTRDRRVGKFAVRNRLPDHWVRFMNILRAAQANAFADQDEDGEAEAEALQTTEDADSSCDYCARCAPSDRQRSKKKSQQCALCLTQLHFSCSQRLQNEFVKQCTSSSSSSSSTSVVPVAPGKLQLHPLLSSGRRGTGIAHHTCRMPHHCIMIRNRAHVHATPHGPCPFCLF